MGVSEHQAVLLGWEWEVAGLLLLVGSPWHSCHQDAGVTLESEGQDTSQGNILHLKCPEWGSLGSFLKTQ